jgi:hypothetical protein
MPRPFNTWTVLPHGRLTQIDDGLLTVVGQLPMPIGDFPRRMTVVRLADGRLVIYSAIALHDSEMVGLESYGEPSILVVPSEIHRMDARIWKQRYPSLTVFAPEGGREKIGDVVPVDVTSIDLHDPEVDLRTIPGTQEAAIVVRRPTGTTLIVNDLIWNLPHRPGVAGRLLKAFGFTGPRRIPPVVARKGIDERAPFVAQLEAWSHLPNLTRIIVSHGDIITSNPARLLCQLAERVAA